MKIIRKYNILPIFDFIFFHANKKQRIADEGSVPEMRIWSISWIYSD